ncbi:hypothetical protein AAE478_009748 [Parahypoxylon ruwenzoriense]
MAGENQSEVMDPRSKPESIARVSDNGVSDGKAQDSQAESKGVHQDTLKPTVALVLINGEWWPRLVLPQREQELHILIDWLRQEPQSTHVEYTRMMLAATSGCQLEETGPGKNPVLANKRWGVRLYLQDISSQIGQHADGSVEAAPVHRPNHDAWRTSIEEKLRASRERRLHDTRESEVSIREADADAQKAKSARKGPAVGDRGRSANSRIAQMKERMRKIREKEIFLKGWEARLAAAELKRMLSFFFAGGFVCMLAVITHAHYCVK